MNNNIYFDDDDLIPNNSNIIPFKDKKPGKLPKSIRISKVVELLEKGESAKDISEKLGVSITTIYSDIDLIQNTQIAGDINPNVKMLRRLEVDSDIESQIQFGEEVMEHYKYKSPRSVAEIMKVICNLLALRMKLWKLDITTTISKSEDTYIVEDIIPDEVKDTIANSLVKHLSKGVKVTI